MISQGLLLLLFGISFASHGMMMTQAANPLLLVSLDGLRADKLDAFLKDNPNSYLKSFLNSGLKADYMVPVFPSSTFANHWTLVTGH
jgi:predicted AlkP superfamily pyrophosphatase or phosphodiesterase